MTTTSFINTWWSKKSGFPALIENNSYQKYTAENGYWKEIIPNYEEVLSLLQENLPFHAVIEGKHETNPNPNHVKKYLTKGMSLILLQPHEFMPRLMHLMRELRCTFFDPFCIESSYLFLTEGKGKPGMCAHHDGDVYSVWIQISGKRTVSIGRQVDSGSPLEGNYEEENFETIELEPGSLLYLGPRVLHKVVCHEPSFALSLTWQPLSTTEILADFSDFLSEQDIENSLRKDQVTQNNLENLLNTHWKDISKQQFSTFFNIKKEQLSIVNGKPQYANTKKHPKIPVSILPEDVEELSGWEMVVVE